MSADGKAVPFCKEKSIVLTCKDGMWTIKYFDSLENPITIVDQRRAEKTLAVSYRLHKVELIKKRAMENSNA